MSEKCSDFCQDDLADDDIMLLDNGKEVRADYSLIVRTETRCAARLSGVIATCSQQCVCSPTPLPEGVHVGGHPDQPGGDQTESQSLPGKHICLFGVCVYSAHASVCGIHC